MAAGKTYEITFNDGTYPGLFGGTIYLSEEYDADNNCSVIKLTKQGCWCGHRNGTFYWNGYLNVDGQRVWTGDSSFCSYADSVGSFNYEQHGSYPYASGRIDHNADGTKTVPVVFSLWGTCSTGFSYSCAVSTSITLTDIPRKSSMTVHNGVLGSAVSVQITKGAPGFTHTITYSCGNASGTVCSKSSASSISWTPPLELSRQNTVGTTVDVAFTLTTYNGETAMGSEQYDARYNIPDSIKPSVSSGWAKAAVSNTGAVAGITCYVQGYSKATVTFDTSKISMAYGAGIASYKVVCGNQTITESPYTTAVLGGSGNVTLQCTVTDTRGRSAGGNLTITVQPYSKPTLSGVELYRCNSAGTAADSGTYIAAKATGGISSLSGQNTQNLRVRYKLSTGNYGGYTALTSGTRKVIGGGAVAVTGSYVAEISLTDKLGNTAVYTQIIPTESVFFSGAESGTAAGFGKHPEGSNVLDVGWDLHARKKLTVDGNAYFGGGLNLKNGTYISGENVGNEPRNHGIEIGASGKDYMNFYEWGALFNFYKSQSGTNTLLGRITTNGWEGKINGKTLLDGTYPVGSIYMSTQNTSPASLFGGTWTAIARGRVLMGSTTNGGIQGNTSNWCGALDRTDLGFPVGERGGQYFHTLTVAEMPAHNHMIGNGHFYNASYNNSGKVGNTMHEANPVQSNTSWGHTNDTGGGDKHNNNAPYEVVYMWQRTA